MKIVLLGMSLLFASAVQAETPQFTWNKKEIESLQGKSISAAYCKKPTGYFTKEACAIGKKDSGFAKFKFKTLELVNPTTLRVGDGSRSFEISRGSTMGEYTINGKNFDLAKLTPEEIYNKISAAIPKLSASLFINRAEAADDEKSPLAVAVSTMLSAKTDDDTCVATQAVVDACHGNSDEKLATTSTSIATGMLNFRMANEISAKVAAAKQIKVWQQAFDSMVLLYALDIKRALDKAPNSCEVLAGGKKVTAKRALAKCANDIQVAQVEMVKFIEEFKVTDYANYQKDEQELKEVVDAFSKRNKDWVPNDSISMVQANKVGAWRSLKKAMESKENKIPAPAPAGEQNR